MGKQYFITLKFGNKSTILRQENLMKKRILFQSNYDNCRNQLKRITDTFSNPNYQNACGTYTEKLCQNTPFSRNLSLLELTIGSIYKNYKKIPRLSCKSGVFPWTFFYRPQNCLKSVKIVELGTKSGTRKTFFSNRPRKSYIVCIRVSRLQCIDVYNYLDQYIMWLCIA